MTNFTNYLLINKKGELKEVINTNDITFGAEYRKAIRLGWTNKKGVEKPLFYFCKISPSIAKTKKFEKNFFGRRVVGRHVPHFSLWVLSEILRKKRVESMRCKIFLKKI